MPQEQQQPLPRRKRKPPNPWVKPWIFQRKEKGYLLADLIQTDIPGYQNFVRMPLAFLMSLKNTYATSSRHQSPISGKALEVRLKLAITLRHLATRETDTSFQYHWLVGRTTICKFIPRSAKPSLLNICTVLLILKTRKRWKRSSKPDGMSPML